MYLTIEVGTSNDYNMYVLEKLAEARKVVDKKYYQ